MVLLLTPCTKIQSKRNTDLNVTAKTIEYLQESKGVNLRDPGLGKVLCDTKKIATKEKR